MQRLDDTFEIRAVLIPPEAHSVSSQQVQQFLRENTTSPLIIRATTYALSTIPADRWDGISAYLKRNWSLMSSVEINILANMPLERLNSVLPYIEENNSTNRHTLRALSEISDENLNDFKIFMKNYHFLDYNRYPLIFSRMDKESWPAFAAFIDLNQFDAHTLNWGMVYAKYPVQNWNILFHLIEENKIIQDVSQYIMNQLAQMTATDSLAYLRFIMVHQVTHLDAKNVLVDVPEDKRERLYVFAKEHNLVNKIAELVKIPDEKWDVVTRFILNHPDTCAVTLSMLTIEQCVELDRFVIQHQLTKGEWITKFAQIPVENRENLLSYQQEYNPKIYEIHNISRISMDNWPRFMATIKGLGFTNPTMINKFASVDPDEWEELASFIAKKQINDKYVLSALINTPKSCYQALLAYIEQFNIQDQYIIHGLALIHDVQQWEKIREISEPLLQPPLPPKHRGIILLDVYEITKPEYRIDRAMPVYDEEERQGRIAFALAEIANGHMPKDPEQYAVRLQQTIHTPLRQLLKMNKEIQAGAAVIESQSNVAESTLVATAVAEPEPNNNMQSNTRSWCTYFTAAAYCWGDNGTSNTRNVPGYY
jgi:hypothetical protein